MERKKIVLVIVEGMSEEVALSLILERIFANDAVRVHVMRGDITTMKGSAPNNIVAKVGDEIKAYAKKNYFLVSDFKQVIHIVDTDGAYIPDDSVVSDDEAKEPVYSLAEIRTCRKGDIEDRNHQKHSNLDRLCDRKEILKIPYSVYYMSCNLDHVLHNKQNSTDAEKKSDAEVFEEKYCENIPSFLDFICKSDFSVTGDYSETWDYIRKELHSLERHSNFGLCFTP